MRERLSKRGDIHTLRYSLAVPIRVQLYTWALQWSVIASSLTIAVNDHVVSLIWLLVYRSVVLCRRQTRRYSKAFLSIEHNGQVRIEGGPGLALRSSDWTHLVRLPGFASVRFLTSRAKPIEIVIFCRYDQRSFYSRLVRHLTLFQKSSTTSFVHNERH